MSSQFARSNRCYHGRPSGSCIPCADFQDIEADMREFPQLPCIICNKELEPVGRFTETNQPYGGTTFATHGHYGSTVFDPMDGTFLEINLCDKCLVLAAERQAVYVSRSRRPVFLTDVPGGPVIVGWEYVTRNLIHWNYDQGEFKERRSFTRNEIINYANHPDFSWNLPVDDMLRGYEEWENDD